MIITYPWRCHFCGVSNLADTSTCASCNKPAVASANDIDAAIGAKEPLTEKRAAAWLTPITTAMICLAAGASNLWLWLKTGMTYDLNGAIAFLLLALYLMKYQPRSIVSVLRELGASNKPPLLSLSLYFGALLFFAVSLVGRFI